jgi:hypothetical protein
VLVFSLLFIIQFFWWFFSFFVLASVCPGGYAGLSQGLLGEYLMMLGTNLFGLPNVFQTGFELASGSGGSSPDSSV